MFLVYDTIFFLCFPLTNDTYLFILFENNILTKIYLENYKNIKNIMMLLLCINHIQNYTKT